MTVNHLSCCCLSVLQDKVRPGDAWYLLFSAAHASPRAREMVWSFIREKWALLIERYKGMFLITRIVDVSLASVVLV